MRFIVQTSSLPSLSFPSRIGSAGVSAVAVATGYYHTCAIVTGGSLVCWGSNGNGQLGLGSTTDQHSPQAVSLGSGVPGGWGRELINRRMDANETVWCAEQVRASIRKVDHRIHLRSHSHPP